MSLFPQIRPKKTSRQLLKWVWALYERLWRLQWAVITQCPVSVSPLLYPLKTWAYLCSFSSVAVWNRQTQSFFTRSVLLLAFSPYLFSCLHKFPYSFFHYLCTKTFHILSVHSSFSAPLLHIRVGLFCVLCVCQAWNFRSKATWPAEGQYFFEVTKATCLLLQHVTINQWMCLLMTLRITNLLSWTLSKGR